MAKHKDFDVMLKSTYADVTEIPSEYQSLYTERNGNYELTGISGVKTQEDVSRVQTALTRERDEHKTTKEKANVWGELDHADVMSKIDRIGELELAAKGTLDQAGIDELVEKRLEASKNALIAPRDRDLAKKDETITSLMSRVSAYELKETRSTIQSDVQKAVVAAKVIPEAHGDVEMWASQLFEVSDDGKVVTRDGVGVAPGLDATMWLTEMQTSKPHWWAASGGGGAHTPQRGGGGGGGTGNPWAGDNMTTRSKYVQEHGVDKATQMAAAAGKTLAGQPLK
jgi:hypothetical protein